MNPTETSPTQDTTSSAPGFGPAGNTNPSGTPEGTTVEKVRRAAGKAAGQAKEKVSQIAHEQKDAASDKIGGYSSRLRETARSAEGEDPNIAHFANQAADRLQSVADYVRETDFNRIKQDAAGVARRHPALFMGGMLVAGLVLGSLVKASVQSLNENEEGDDVGDAEDPVRNDSMGSDGQPNYAAGGGADSSASPGPIDFKPATP